jgi:hypothetical protein
VAQGRALFAVHFPGPAHDFAAPVWEIRHLWVSQHKQSNARVCFTRYGSRSDPLPARFAEVVKALCVRELQSASTVRFQVEAARLLWQALERRLGAEAERFAWRSLSAEDLRAAEREMLRHWSASTTYRHCIVLQGMIARLSAPGVGLVPPIAVAFRTPRPESLERFTLAGQEARREKLPSEEAIAGVADLYARHAREPADRLLAGILALLVATGLRIGEVLTLPRDCLVTEGQGRERVWGMRYHKEKSAGRQKALATYWLTVQQARLARRSIREIRRLTEPARRRAAELEADPETVRLPGVAWEAELTREQVAQLLGYADPGSLSKVPLSQLPRHPGGRPGGGSVYRAAEVMAYLRRIRVKELWVVKRGDGTCQPLSESLLVVFRNFFHPSRGTNPLLVVPVSEQQVNDFLGGRDSIAASGERVPVVRSAFERFGIREKNGSFVRMTTHGFRHWLHTQAALSGVEDALLARWMGREHQGDLEAYQHLTPPERLARLKGALRAGQLRGRVSEMYFALHEDVRDVFLEDQLQAVHVTPFGLCVHDFTLSPCPKLLNCVKHCRDFVHDPANARQRTRLVQLQHRTRAVLAQARQQRDLGGDDLAESYLADAEETLAGIEAILGAVPEGGESRVQPFRDRPSRFQPFAAEANGAPPQQ